MTLCLVPALFIAIYCLFIILPSTPPPVFNIDCSPRCPGAEGVSASLPPPELAPAALGAGGSGDIQALSPLMSPSRGAGQKGKQRPAEGGSASTEPLSITTTPILRGGSYLPSHHWNRHRLPPGLAGLVSPPRGASTPLPPGTPRLPEDLGHSRYPGELQTHGECPAGTGSVLPEHRGTGAGTAGSAALIPHRHHQRAPPARRDRCRALITY